MSVIETNAPLVSRAIALRAAAKFLRSGGEWQETPEDYKAAELLADRFDREASCCDDLARRKALKMARNHGAKA